MMILPCLLVYLCPDRSFLRQPASQHLFQSIQTGDMSSCTFKSAVSGCATLNRSAVK